MIYNETLRNILFGYLMILKTIIIFLDVLMFLCLYLKTAFVFYRYTWKYLLVKLYDVSDLC